MAYKIDKPSRFGGIGEKLKSGMDIYHKLSVKSALCMDGHILVANFYYPTGVETSNNGVGTHVSTAILDVQTHVMQRKGDEDSVRRIKEMLGSKIKPEPAEDHLDRWASGIGFEIDFVYDKEKELFYAQAVSQERSGQGKWNATAEGSGKTLAEAYDSLDSALEKNYERDPEEDEAETESS